MIAFEEDGTHIEMAFLAFTLVGDSTQFARSPGFLHRLVIIVGNHPVALAVEEGEMCVGWRGEVVCHAVFLQTFLENGQLLVVGTLDEFPGGEIVVCRRCKHLVGRQPAVVPQLDLIRMLFRIFIDEGAALVSIVVFGGDSLEDSRIDEPKLIASARSLVLDS